MTAHDPTFGVGEAVQDAASSAQAPGGEEIELGLDGEGAGEELDELAATAAKRDEYLALAQRTQADFENYRKRTLREAKAAQERGALKLVQSLLPAIDNLDRALAHAADADDDPVLMDGLRLVQRELLGALERVGVTPFGESGERFDPERHEAVAQQPFDGFEPGTVVEVYQPGYMLAGGVIRAARVLVAG